MKSKTLSSFFSIDTAPALAVSKIFVQKHTPGCFKIAYCRIAALFPLNKHPKNDQHQWWMKRSSFMLLSVSMILPAGVYGNELDWSVGGYGGQYFDTEPGSFANGKTNYLNHYMVAITTSKSIWRAEELPLSLEIQGVLGYQFGLASLYEIAVSPVLSWSGFPWKETLQTAFRFGPVGVSYTSSISPLERGPNGEGSQTLNFLIAELGFSLPQKKSEEVFFRIHHRSTFNDLINNHGANGDDFFTVGYRQYY